jgi:hypothetical protein
LRRMHQSVGKGSGGKGLCVGIQHVDSSGKREVEPVQIFLGSYIDNRFNKN